MVIYFLVQVLLNGLLKALLLELQNGKYYFEVKLKDNGSDRDLDGVCKKIGINTSGNNYVLAGTNNPCIGYRTGGVSATQGGNTYKQY